ncbi:transducin beta-like protein 3 [Anabrus simplex]|uniref:transducin beta-like protein 3 n=1 Tax=Anabrus simplex TaxID=316456 RepID=UPI0035A287DD
MGSRKKLKESFELEVKHGAFFTGGHVQWTRDGSQLLCQCGSVVNVLDVDLGKVTSSLGQTDNEAEEDIINTFALSHDNKQLVTSHKSGLLKLWQWNDGVLLKSWKSVHKGPVASLALSPSGLQLVSGGTDGGVRLWDLQKQTCTSSLRGAAGVVNIVCYPNTDFGLVFAAADDAAIRGWDTDSGELRMTLSGHFSKVTAVLFHSDKKHAISCGRDRVMILWDLQKYAAVRTLPAYESLEGMVLLSDTLSLLGQKESEEGIHVATAGERGVIRVWEMLRGREMYVQQNSLVSKAAEEGGLAITDLLYNEEKNCLGVVTVDHNIILHELDTFNCKKQLIGFSEEILDVVFVGQDDSHLAVASNSIDIKLYSTADMGCQLLRGHTDLVLALATTPSNPNLLLSSGKDNTVRLWVMDPEEQVMKAAGVGSRHTASVGDIALSQISASFFLSVSQDSCLKLWTLPSKFNTDVPDTLTVKSTELAHQKDINSVCVSPNDKLAATGSQDKTAKLWSIEDNLTLLGVFRGHKRGIWCVRFSPTDQVLLTTSADCTLKIWSLSDLSCVKTLEGHESSVLRAEFLSRGMQLVSSGADGLLKLWNIKSSECVATLDQHDGRVWALAVSKDESILVTGDSDSQLVKWRDVTEERRLERERAQEQLVLQEQELSNLLQNNELLAALQLALTLDRPLQVLRIVQEVLKQGKSGLEDTLKQLRPDQKETLLKCATTWNCSSKNCHPAQLVLSVLIDDLSCGVLKPSTFSSELEGTIPYTERHFKRLTQLLQDVHYLQYTLACMQPHAK